MPTLDLTLHKGMNTLVSDTLIDDNEFVDSDGFDIFTEPGVLARRLPIGSFMDVGTGLNCFIINRYDTDLIFETSAEKIYRVASNGTETLIRDLSSTKGDTPAITNNSREWSSARYLDNLIFTNENRNGIYIYNPVLWEVTNNSKNEIVELGVDPVASVALDAGLVDFNNDGGELTNSVDYKYRFTYLLVDDAGNIVAEGNPFTTTDLTIGTGVNPADQELVGLASNAAINNKIRQVRMYRTKADLGSYYREAGTRGVSNFGAISPTITIGDADTGSGTISQAATGVHFVTCTYYNSITGEETLPADPVSFTATASAYDTIDVTISSYTGEIITTDVRFDKFRVYMGKDAVSGNIIFHHIGDSTSIEADNSTLAVNNYSESDAAMETSSGNIVTRASTAGSNTDFYWPSYSADSGGTNNLTVISPPDDNSKPVQVKYLTEYKNRIFGLNSDGNESRLYWSDVSNPHAWSALNTADIDPDDDDEGTGLEVINGRLYVFKENSIHVIRDSGFGTFSGGGKIAAVGAGKFLTIAGNSKKVFFYHPSGIYSFNGAQVNKISDKIDNTFDFTLTTTLPIWRYLPN